MNCALVNLKCIITVDTWFKPQEKSVLLATIFFFFLEHYVPNKVELFRANFTHRVVFCLHSVLFLSYFLCDYSGILYLVTY
jgi:hypothetical protein